MSQQQSEYIRDLVETYSRFNAVDEDNYLQELTYGRLIYVVTHLPMNSKMIVAKSIIVGLNESEKLAGYSLTLNVTLPDSTDPNQVFVIDLKRYGVVKPDLYNARFDTLNRIFLNFNDATHYVSSYMHVLEVEMDEKVTAILRGKK